MDILTIGEVLIDLTQTGKDARGIPQFMKRFWVIISY